MPKSLTWRMKRLLDELHDGADLRRLNTRRAVPDRHYWPSPGSRLFTRERRQTADGLVARRLARWCPLLDAGFPHESQRLIPLALPAPREVPDVQC